MNKEIMETKYQKMGHKAMALRDAGEDHIISLALANNISCNVSECYFEHHGGCLASSVLITNEGCITDRRLLED